MSACFSTFLSLAAEAGYGEAQHNLAHMFYGGFGVDRDPVKALEWGQKGMLSRTLQKYQHSQRNWFASR
jgi:TPR repeat protein